MVTDLSTANVIDTKSGTGFTVDVTAVNLLSDLSIKDFAVLIDSVVEPNSNITKTSQTVLTYTGPSIPSSTVEVRRITPQDRFQEINFAEKLSSTVFNEEIDRIIRKAYEYTLNGIGPGSVATTVTPLNEAYPGTWSGDTIRSRTANRLFTEFEARGTLSENESITGTWTAATQTDLDNSTNLATTAYSDTRVSNALSSSPILGGNPTATTQNADNDSTRIATTAFVNDRAIREHFTSVKTTDQTFTTGLAANLINYDIETDPDSNFSNTTGIYTVPVTGTYLVNASFNSQVDSGIAKTTFELNINAGTTFISIYETHQGGSAFHGASGSLIIELTATDTLRLRFTIVGVNPKVIDARFSAVLLFTA